MSSIQASTVKVAGHGAEVEFATLIGGRVQRGTHTDKKDVIDQQDRSHSVKTGTWWQLFLYSRNRFVTNTIFQGLGDIAEIMIACLDAYPEDFSDYLNDKGIAKTALQPNMRKLRLELEKPNMLKAFLDKSIFDGGSAEYLSIYRGAANTNTGSKVFHIFHRTEVVPALHKWIEIRNSQARHSGQMDDQKVTFHSKKHKQNLGEIETRHDSPRHYREMKFRANSKLVFEILTAEINQVHELTPYLIAYGQAIKSFSI